MSVLAVSVKSLQRWPGQKNSLKGSGTVVVDGSCHCQILVEIRRDGINSVVQASHLIATQNPRSVFTRRISMN